MVIGSMGLLCCLGVFVEMIRKPEGDVVFADKEVAGDDAEAPHGLWQTLGLVGWVNRADRAAWIYPRTDFVLVCVLYDPSGVVKSTQSGIDRRGVLFICLMAVAA